MDIPRTSSSSIRSELSAQFGSAYGKADLSDPLYNQKVQPIPSHLTALEMRNRLGPGNWEKIFSFTFVRNPWDRMLSLYRYRISCGEIEESLSFKSYLKLFFEPPDTKYSPYRYHGYYYQSFDYLADQQGNIIVDFVGRFESRKRDLQVIMEKSRCSNLGRLRLQASGDPRSYRAYYCDQSKEMVLKICQKDVLAFGYQF